MQLSKIHSHLQNITCFNHANYGSLLLETRKLLKQNVLRLKLR